MKTESAFTLEVAYHLCMTIAVFNAILVWSVYNTLVLPFITCQLSERCQICDRERESYVG